MAKKKIFVSFDYEKAGSIIIEGDPQSMMISQTKP
jgi:hypothetical protein